MWIVYPTLHGNNYEGNSADIQMIAAQIDFP
jgi:hypothetical protein